MESSLVEDHGLNAHTCGYCKSKEDTSLSHGFVAHRLAVEDYQELVDRGFRRSGKWLYLPWQERTCCPQYTIRLHAPSFRPNRDQVKTLKKVSTFLRQGAEGAVKPTTAGDAAMCEKHTTEDALKLAISASLGRALAALVAAGHLPTATYPALVVNAPAARLAAHLHPSVCLTSPVPLAVAAAVRRAGFPAVEASEVASLLLGALVEDPASTGWRAECSPEASGGHLNFLRTGALTAESVSTTKEPAESLRRKPAFSQRAAAVVHDPKAVSGLEVRTARSSFDADEYALYRRYQIAVHGDEPDKITPTAYRRFLVDSPLVGTGEFYGSFHQQYRLGGRLVMVGVVDVLPRCLSSVYLFWDPDFAHLSLGKLSALKEIAWAHRASLEHPRLQYYYLGFYIHSCPKMRYKGAYGPAELLCPVRKTWVPLFECIPKLERQKYCVLGDGDDERGWSDEEKNDDASIGDLPVLPPPYKTVVPFRDFATSSKNKEVLRKLTEKVMEWQKRCGKTVAARAIYIVS